MQPSVVKREVTEMRIRTLLLTLVLLSATSSSALAGIGGRFPIPTLGDAGLVMLGLGLMGCGITALRRRRPSLENRQ
jgi:hypothetical protein